MKAWMHHHFYEVTPRVGDLFKLCCGTDVEQLRGWLLFVGYDSDGYPNFLAADDRVWAWPNFINLEIISRIEEAGDEG